MRIDNEARLTQGGLEWIIDRYSEAEVELFYDREGMDEQVGCHECHARMSADYDEPESHVESARLAVEDDRHRACRKEKLRFRLMRGNNWAAATYETEGEGILDMLREVSADYRLDPVNAVELGYLAAQVWHGRI